MSDTFPLKSLWQRKINHSIKKNILEFVETTKKKKAGNDEVTTDLVCEWKKWHRGAKSKKGLTPEGHGGTCLFHRTALHDLIKR